MEDSRFDPDDIASALTHVHRRVRSVDLGGGDALLTGVLVGAEPTFWSRVELRLTGFARWVKWKLIGKPFTLAVAIAFILSWIVVGVVASLDSPPKFPVLLLLINLPQVPILISLQVSSNIGEVEADERDEAAKETFDAIKKVVDANYLLLQKLVDKT